MNQKKTALVAVVSALLIVAGIIWFFSPEEEGPPPTPQDNEQYSPNAKVAPLEIVSRWYLTTQDLPGPTGGNVERLFVKTLKRDFKYLTMETVNTRNEHYSTNIQLMSEDGGTVYEGYWKNNHNGWEGEIYLHFTEKNQASGWLIDENKKYVIATLYEIQSFE
ncbi:hypothetical protein ACFLZC_01930 [Patescibacteria group bacterium]